jgi:DNA repair exonuclease SbcCD ATPase subunit
MHAFEVADMKKNSLLTPRLLAAGLLALVAALPCQAQEAKVSKEREALRRVQVALKSAQDQQAVLQADKARLEQDKAQAVGDISKARAQALGLAAQLKTRDEQSAKLQAELQALQQAGQEQQVAGQTRERELQQQLLAARREGAERQQSAQSVSRLLERSTLALADAEGKNRQLHAIAQDLVKRYLSRTPADVTGIGDPLFGLTDIRLENVAEELRGKLEQQRVN